MKKKLLISISSFCLFVLLLISCRQDVFLQSEEKFDANASKFKVVQLKDIPQVSKFIKQKTGRNDALLPLKMGNEFAKGEIDYANLETSLILMTTDGSTNYYTFGIDNAGNENTI